VSLSESVRRRPATVLVVGAVEPEVQPWLRGAGHAVLGAPDAEAAVAATAGADAVELVVLDGERAGRRDVAAVCRALREDARTADAWLLAIAQRGSRADAALAAGADDYLHRPFSRGELLARARAGLRAARHRADDALIRALLLNVPGAIYRTAWHAGQAVELISDEIERISGHPPAGFLASRRRTLLSLVHAEDRERVERTVEEAAGGSHAFALEYRIVRPDGEVRWVLDRGQVVPGAGGTWIDGALFDITERRRAEEALRRQEIEEARTEELRASRVRIVEAADAARRRIERDLHDGAQQRLVAMALDVRMARSRLERDPSDAPAYLERLGQELAAASDELRELARGIHPAVLTDHGLGPAIDALVARSPVPVDLLAVPEDRLPTAAETTAYFTVAEALTNVAKYARATRATVCLELVDGMLVVDVRDDGAGGARAATGSGLSGLADRVAAVDGTLTVHSPPGEGTHLRAVLPLTPGADG
jgi:PAS domain S-box-containing protein